MLFVQNAVIKEIVEDLTLLVQKDAQHKFQIQKTLSNLKKLIVFLNIIKLQKR